MMEDFIKEKLKEKLSSLKLKFNKEKVALHLVEGDDYYGVCYNYMGTGIHIPVEEVNEEECKEEGITIWKTWTYQN